MSDSASPRWWLHGLLFAATCITVFLSGVVHLYAETWNQALYNGAAFLAGVMGIMVAHEMGHYLVARRYGVPVSLPYFIPLPPVVSLFGTMGAVIVMRGRIRTRTALLAVGAAGPLAGMAVAVPLLLYGLWRIPVVPLSEVGFMEGQSLLYLAAKRLVVGPIPPGFDIVLDASPWAFAGWFGMLVTMLNLLPIGQLDGGHVVYGLFGARHAVVSRWVFAGLFAFGAAVSAVLGFRAYLAGASTDAVIAHALPGMSWLVLAGVMALVFRKRGLVHPPTDDDAAAPWARAMGWACVALFAATFMPVVFRPVGTW